MKKYWLAVIGLILLIGFVSGTGSIVVWGGEFPDRLIPPLGNDYIAIAANFEYSLALKSDNSIEGWGMNSGQGIPPPGNDYVTISAGFLHGLALKSDGSIEGWGCDSYGQATPPPGNDYVAIAAGGRHSLALKSDGSIVGWGYDNYGQATPPPGNDYVAISAGWDYGLALKSDGSIVGWGHDNYGQATPPPGNDYVAISAGWNYGLALKSDGSIVGWGHDNYGQATPPPDNDYVAIAAGLNHAVGLVVPNTVPTAEAGSDKTVDEGAEVTFSGSFNDPDAGDTHAIEWDFGDESTTSGTLTPTHTYADEGIYTVTLNVTDNKGASGIDTLNVTVQNVAPTVSIDGVDHEFPDVIFPLEELGFTGSFTDPGWLDTHTATWAFGDGSTSPGSMDEENVPPSSSGTTTGSHTYTDPGDYEVILTIEDNDSDSESSTCAIHVASETEMGEAIESYILALPDEAFKNNPDQRKNDFRKKINDAMKLVAKGNTQGAIEILLDDIRAKADGSLSGNPKNDVIIDPDAQQDLCAMVDYFVNYLES